MLRKTLPILLFLCGQISGISQDVLFVDEFNDEKLPGWRISDAEGGEVVVRNGKLILGKNTDLKIETRKSDIWLDYTTTLKLRLLQMQEVSGSQFSSDMALDVSTCGPINNSTFRPMKEKFRSTQ